MKDISFFDLNGTPSFLLVYYHRAEFAQNMRRIFHENIDCKIQFLNGKGRKEKGKKC